MSTSEKQFYYKEADAIAELYIKDLSPFCIRIEKAGSLRRLKNYINDIEIVCIPKKEKVETGLFEIEDFYCSGFVNYLKELEIIKGNPATGKYIQFKLKENINLDLFIATEINYGLIKMIRTGSWQFSKRMMTECKRKGYYVKDGLLWSVNENKIIPVPEEKDFFKITGLEEIDPSARIY